MAEEKFKSFKEMTINERMASVRKLNGYNQADAAQAFGLKNSTYAQRERRGEISCEFLVKFCEFFEVDICLMLYGEKQGKEENTTSLPQPMSRPKLPENLPGLPKEIKFGPSQRSLLIILHHFTEPQRKAVYKFVEKMQRTKKYKFKDEYPEFFE